MLPPWIVARRWWAVRGHWDEVCDQCGRCCFQREVDEDGDVVIDYAAPCAFLDVETRQCRVYDRRFEVCPACHRLTLRHALFSRHLPEGCAYARLFRE